MNGLRRRLALALLPAMTLAGCGFHLSGDRPLPEELRSVYVEAVDPYKVTAPRVESAIEKRIASRGGQVKSRAADARATLRLSDLKQTQEVLSIGADSKAIEYRLIIRVRYELDSGGKVLVPSDTLSVSRDFSFSAQQILAKEAEQAKLNDYLQDDMAELLLLRLEAGLGQRPPSD
jgi:LPS-assembly lipoprotein